MGIYEEDYQAPEGVDQDENDEDFMDDPNPEL